MKIYRVSDGASFIVPRDKLAEAEGICNNFAKWIGIPGEFDYFKKAYISDVNNFVIIKESGKVKVKGRYVYENLPLQKNASNRISAKAAFEYLVNGVSIRKTIEDETDIFMFCIGKRARKTPKKGLPVYTYFDKGLRDNAIPLQKTIRYIVSKTGGVIKSVYSNGSEAFLEAYPKSRGSMKVWYQTVLNTIIPKSAQDYDIDYIYYMKESHELTQFKKSEKNIIVNQLKLKL